jgi:hypothetical protein
MHNAKWLKAMDIEPENITEIGPLDPRKPLGHRAYGHIAHLPGSRTGPKDRHISEGQAKICCLKPRDKHDTIIVQEKLDGSNVCIAKINGEVIPLIRSGYKAQSSRFEMHHKFHLWVMENIVKFTSLLEEGERCSGEWLLQAHGTKYELPHAPFVAFDIMRGQSRALHQEVTHRCLDQEIVTPYTFHIGSSLSITDALKKLGNGNHGALDPIEGAVWRVERKGKVDFLAKYVRHDKQDGKYLPEISREPAVWNPWSPTAPPPRPKKFKP